MFLRCLLVEPYSLTASKPSNSPKILKTWGDHVKKRRMALKMFQKDVARTLKTTEDTVVNWELNHTEPTLKNIPAIVGLLGYVPEDLLPSRTLVEEIKRYRVLRGLTRKQMAKVLNIDEATLQRLENLTKTSTKTLEKVSDFLKSLNRQEQ